MWITQPLMVQKVLKFLIFICAKHTLTRRLKQNLHTCSWFFLNLGSVVSQQKTFGFLYKLLGFLKELGQYYYKSYYSVVSPGLCQELWSVHCLLSSPLFSALSSATSLITFLAALWSVSTKEFIFVAVTRFIYSRERWRALGAKYL